MKVFIILMLLCSGVFASVPEEGYVEQDGVLVIVGEGEFADYSFSFGDIITIDMEYQRGVEIYLTEDSVVEKKDGVLTINRVENKE